MVSADEQERHDVEIRGLVEAVENVAGPKSLIVLAVVSKEIRAEVKKRFASGGVEVTTQDNLQSAISSLAASSYGKRLAVVISSSFTYIDIQVPEAFTSLEISSASQKNVHLEPTSTYCSIPLTSWNRRRSHKTHELTTRSHIYLEVPDYDISAAGHVPPPFAFEDEDDAPAAASSIRATMESEKTLQVSSKQSQALPWLAAGAGAAAATVSAVSNFKFGLLGAYVSCGPLTAGAISATGVGSLAVAGAASLGVGVGVAAAVYFIPWAKLATWAAKAWDLFMIFVKSVWEFFKRAFSWFVSFLKMLIKAMRDFLTHVKNVVLWGFGATFGNSSSRQKGAWNA